MPDAFKFRLTCLPRTVSPAVRESAVEANVPHHGDAGRCDRGRLRYAALRLVSEGKMTEAYVAGLSPKSLIAQTLKKMESNAVTSRSTAPLHSTPCSTFSCTEAQKVSLNSCCVFGKKRNPNLEVHQHQNPRNASQEEVPERFNYDGRKCTM